MQELIKISSQTINGDAVQTVNARDLHEFLESRQDFTTWIKARIERYKFVEGLDFTITLGKSSGGRPSTEYHITLDMAKELGQVEASSQGRIIRRYFIECEKQLSARTTALPDRRRLALMVIEEADRADLAEANVIRLEHQIEEEQPKITAYEQVINAEGFFSRRDVAKHLQIKQLEFNQHLIRIKHWTKNNLPTALALHREFAVMKVYVDQSGYLRNRPMITPKGEHFYRMRMQRGEFDNFLDTGNPRNSNQRRAA